MYTRIQELCYRKFGNLSLNRSASSKAAVLVFLLTTIVTIAIAEKIEKQKVAQEQAYIENLAQEYSSKIQTSLEKTLSITYPLAALVKEYRGIIPNFEIVGKELLSLYPSAYAVALSPHNSESQLVFSQPHNSAIGTIEIPCLYHEPKIPFAQNLDKPILAEPFPSQKTFAGSAGCLPVFLDNPTGMGSFWGFSSVVINYQQLFRSVNLENLTNRKMAYAIYFVDSQNQEKEQIFASSTHQDRGKGKRFVSQIIPIPNGFWELCIFPASNWQQTPRFLISSLLGIFISFLLAALVKLFLDAKAHAGELEKVTYFDPLTSLPNRRLLLYRLEQIVSSSERRQSKVAVCYLDLDSFKRVNDRLGNRAGDYILVRIAKRLQKFLRVDDVIARIGGDEFAIILRDIASLEEAELIIARILEAVTTPIVFEAEVVAVSTSIGVTVYPEDSSSTENLLRHANQAMLLAKEYRKGGYIAYKEVEQLELPSS